MVKAKPARPPRRPLPRPPRRPGPPRGSLVSRAVAAAALGVTPSQLSRWVDDGAPVAVRGSRGHRARYHVKRLRAWKDQRATSGGPAAVVGLAEERAKLARAQAERWDQSNRARRAQLVERAAAVSEGRAVVRAVKARLLRISSAAVARGTVAPENVAALEALVLEAVGEFSKWRSVADAPPAVAAMDEGAAATAAERRTS